MTDPQRDPFKLLAGRPVPEPDDAAMRAAIASAREEFARQVHDKAPVSRGGWLSWVRGRSSAAQGWLVPGGLVAACVLVALTVFPGIFASDNGEQSRTGTEMAEMPGDTGEGIEDGGRRFGAQPIPQAPLDLDNLSRVDLSSLTLFATEDLRLGFKLEDDIYQLYLIGGDSALPMDQVQLPAGRRVEIIDAFRYPRPRGEPEIIAVETRRFTDSLDEEPNERLWRAYLLDETGARFDARLTSVLSGVADRAEAERSIADAVRR